MNRLRRWQKSILVVVGIVALAILANLFLSAGAGAQPTGSCGSVPGRACDYGWFYNRYTDGDDDDDNLFEDGLYADDIEELVGILRGHIRCQAPGTPGGRFSTSQDNREATGAAFIVLAILGAQPGTAKDQACVRWNEWEALVRDYDSQGLIRYNELHDVDVNGGFDFDHDDVVRYQEDSAEDAIVIYDTSGNVLHAIQRFCGNPLNRQLSLPPLTPPTPPTGSVNPPTPPGPGTPPTPPGFNTGDPNINSSCAVISGRASDPKDAAYAVPVVATYSIGGQSNAVANGPGGTFSMNTPANVRNSLAPVQVTLTGTDSTGTVYTLSGSPITIGPCVVVQPQCGSMAVTPPSLDPGTPYRVSVSVNYSTPAEANLVRSLPGFRFYVNITGPGVNFSDNNVSNGGGNTLQVVGSSIVAELNRPATGAVGSYVVSWGVAASAGAANCGGDGTVAGPDGNPNPPQSFIVSNKSYFSVRGGDIAAGARMSVGGTSCNVTPNPNAGIVGWNRGNGGAYAGAGSQFAGFAAGRLQEFATGQGSAFAPAGLAFANNADAAPNISGGLYGGRFGGGCSRDFMHGVPAAQIQTGNVTIAGLALPDCDGTNAVVCRRSVYVRGNAYITGNITYDDAYANSAAVPSFRLVVEGNIYLAPGVTRLDGLYVAQPSTATSNDGIFYSCAPAPFVAANLRANLSAVCDTALTVNGAVSARQSWLLRTAGSITTTPAETFNFLPEQWVTSLTSQNVGSSIDNYDAITSLPPVL